MKVVSDWNSSVMKAGSGGKSGSSSPSIRRKLERIKQKVRAGARLSASEKAFLRKYAPELYMRAMTQERIRLENEEYLKQKKQRERETENIQSEKKEKQDNMVDFVDREKEIARQLEAVIKEKHIEESRVKGKEEEEQILKERVLEEKTDDESEDMYNKRMVKEFEADVRFRTQKPALPHEASGRIPAFAQGRTAYQMIAESHKITDSEAVLQPRKA